MSPSRHASLAVSLLLAVSLTSGCSAVQSGETVDESRIVEADGATSVAATLDLTSGDLAVAGGATELLEAEFRYNVAEWRPELEYEVNRDEGRLDLSQPRIGAVVGSTVNLWDLRFADDIPIGFDISSSSGNLDLSLEDIEVVEVRVDASSGTVRLDAPGPQLALEEIRTDVSSGATFLVLTGGYSRLRDIRLVASSGDVEIDLTGDWDTNCDVDVDASSGDVTIYVPDDVRVRVRAETSSGRVEASGFEVEGDKYSVDGPRGARRLDMRVRVSSGDITLLIR